MIIKKYIKEKVIKEINAILESISNKAIKTKIKFTEE